MKNILVPTDFSEVSSNALDFAIKIAHAEKATIVLFHSQSPLLIAAEINDFTYSEDLQQEVLNEVHRKMDELLAHVKFEHVSAEKIVRLGLLEDAIHDIVKETKADLVVTGMHSAKGLERLMFQTNSLTIAEKVNCPVLIIPAEVKYHGIKKIMYATDYQFGDIEELKNVCKLADFFKASVIATHINSELKNTVEEEESMDWFAMIADGRIPYENVSYRSVYNKDVNAGLEKAIDLWNIDILCLSTVKENFFKRIFSKNRTKELAHHSNLPLLAIHLSEDNIVG
jgi:nucleotide-binding universal stress UspA family protein